VITSAAVNGAARSAQKAVMKEPVISLFIAKILFGRYQYFENSVNRLIVGQTLVDNRD